MDDWGVIVIDNADNLVSVKKKESFWQNKLNTFIPCKLNEREVCIDIG